MKKTILFLTTLLFTSVLNAKSYDLSVLHIYQPKPGDTISSKGHFTIKYTLYNNGPDAISSGDELDLFYSIGGWVINSSSPIIVAHGNIPAGDSEVITDNTFSATWSGYPKDTIKQMCLNITPSDASADPNLGNNFNCVYLTFLDVHNIISNVSHITVFPNPATTKVNFQISLNSPDITTIQLLDITGRLIKEKQQHLSSGINTIPLNISTLPNGLYFYQAVIGSQVTAGKLEISR